MVMEGQDQQRTVIFLFMVATELLLLLTNIMQKIFRSLAAWVRIAGVFISKKKQCWISDNAIVAKSIIDDNEYFDYCLLKKLNLYNYHIGTGQQLLTQGVLNAIPCPAYSKEEICSFNQHMESVFKSINRYNAEINRLNRVCSALLSSISFQVNDGKAKSRKSFVMTKGV